MFYELSPAVSCTSWSFWVVFKGCPASAICFGKWFVCLPACPSVLFTVGLAASKGIIAKWHEGSQGGGSGFCQHQAAILNQGGRQKHDFGVTSPDFGCGRSNLANLDFSDDSVAHLAEQLHPMPIWILSPNSVCGLPRGKQQSPFMFGCWPACWIKIAEETRWSKLHKIGWFSRGCCPVWQNSSNLCQFGCLLRYCFKGSQSRGSVLLCTFGHLVPRWIKMADQINPNISSHKNQIDSGMDQVFPRSES